MGLKEKENYFGVSEKERALSLFDKFFTNLK